MDEPSNALVLQIREARDAVASAQVRLDTALSRLAVSERAEKVMVSEALRKALLNVAQARDVLDAIEPIVKTLEPSAD